MCGARFVAAAAAAAACVKSTMQLLGGGSGVDGGRATGLRRYSVDLVWVVAILV